MSRGRGVTLQRYSTGALSDAKVFNRAEGLSWTSGERIRTEQNIQDWFGSRPQAGRQVTRGFPANNRFADPSCRRSPSAGSAWQSVVQGRRVSGRGGRGGRRITNKKLINTRVN